MTGGKVTTRGGLLALAAAGAFAVAACQGNGQAVQCTAASAQEPVIAAIKEGLEQKVAKLMRQAGTGRGASMSKIRAIVAQLTISLDDIRTSKVDPNSTKRFCAGALKIRFASDTLESADRARAAADLNTVSDMADAADIERQADSFSTAIEFNVQPTDDGSKVFAETESGESLYDFTAEVLSSALMRSAVEEGQRQQQQSADQQAAEQDAALSEQRAANVAAARTDNQLALQTITAVWKGLGATTRSRLLPLQRAWIRKKAADCAVEAAAASIDATEREVARLGCDTRVTQERLTFLNGFRNEEPVQDAGFGADDVPANESY